MFSFALYDSYQDEIIFGRDEGGEKPLFFEQKTVGDIIFNHDGSLILTSSSENYYGHSDKNAIVWSTATGQKLFEFRQEEYVQSLALSSDQRFVFTSMWNGGKVRLGSYSGERYR